MSALPPGARRLVPVAVTAVLLLSLLQGCGRLGTPKVIYVARHGQTNWNRIWRFQGDPDLDPVGYVNRASLWLLLKDQPIREIYTSERRRTQTTAALVAREKGLKIKPRAALNEIEPGVFEGMCFADVNPDRATDADRECSVAARTSHPEATLKQLRPVVERMHDPSPAKTALPLGESHVDVLERSKPFVEELRRRDKNSEILLIGHGVTNRIVLHQLLGWPLEKMMKVFQGNDQVYRVEDAGTGQARLSLYTPGVGWKQCSPPTEPRQRYLDCHPKREDAPPAPTQPPPPPPESESEAASDEGADSDNANKQ